MSKIELKDEIEKLTDFLFPNLMRLSLKEIRFIKQLAMESEILFKDDSKDKIVDTHDMDPFSDYPHFD